MTRTRPRIGLTQRVDEIAGRDERRDALDQAWTPVLARAGLTGVPIPNRLDDPVAFVDDLGLDALILTGGNDIGSIPERDALERALLELARRRRMPVLGVCRGMQMMAVDAGATLVHVDGHVRNPHALTVIDGAPAWLRPERVVNTFHDWAVAADDVPTGFLTLATAPDGTVEAMRHRTHPQVAVMWHPERADPERPQSRPGEASPDDIAMLGSVLEAVAAR